MSDTPDGMTLEEFVRQSCRAHGLDFEAIEDVQLNHPQAPTKVIVWFRDNPEPLTIDIKYPEQG